VQLPLHASLFGLSQTLEGLILANVRDLISCHCRSWGSYPSELFPAPELYQARHLAIPSQRLTNFPLKENRLRPQGLLSRCDPFQHWEYCIPLPADALLSFNHFHGFLCVRLPTSLNVESAHSLHFGAVQARLQKGLSAFFP
jgi:hypothetical protein